MTSFSNCVIFKGNQMPEYFFNPVVIEREDDLFVVTVGSLEVAIRLTDENLEVLDNALTLKSASPVQINARLKFDEVEDA